MSDPMTPAVATVDPKSWEGHTPGPWTVVGSAIFKTGSDCAAVAVIADPECRLATDIKPLEMWSDRWEEGMANAALLSAAPTLAAENAALREQVRVLRGVLIQAAKYDVTLATIRAALASTDPAREAGR